MRLEDDFRIHTPHNRLILLSIPLVLSFFVHLWNPLGFPSPDFDEGIYMRRAMHVIEGQGPQEWKTHSPYMIIRTLDTFLAACFGNNRLS